MGKLLSEKIASNRWGTKVVEQIANDLQKELPGLRGFSYRNLMNMRRFYAQYQDVTFLQTVSAEIDTEEGLIAGSQFWQISFSHHIMLLNRCSENHERLFYVVKAASQYWSLSIMEHYIEVDLYNNQGKLPNNFSATMPEDQSSSALQVFQDEYLMDFIDPSDTPNERVFEQSMIADVKNLIVTLGKGFCFIANQFRLELAGEEFFVDLLFFNRHLQCLVAFELKRGKFKPEYAGQLNFYLNVLDEKVRLSHENASIGIVLCKEKSNTVVEFSIRNIDKALGVATYRTTRETPKELRDILPAADELARLL